MLTVIKAYLIIGIVFESVLHYGIGFRGNVEGAPIPLYILGKILSLLLGILVWPWTAYGRWKRHGRVF